MTKPLPTYEDLIVVIKAGYTIREACKLLNTYNARIAEVLAKKTGKSYGDLQKQYNAIPVKSTSDFAKIADTQADITKILLKKQKEYLAGKKLPVILKELGVGYKSFEHHARKRGISFNRRKANQSLKTKWQDIIKQ